MSSQRLRGHTVRSQLIVALSAPVFAMAAVVAGGGFSATALAKPVSGVQVMSMANAASALTLNSSFAAHPRHPNAASALRPAAVRTTSRHRRHHGLAAKQVAWNIMRWFGWRPRWQFRYLNWLWERESSWNVYATNPFSGAYGIPQAVPGAKMGSVSSNWRTCARTQIRWGMRYIKATYGSPRHAWAHEVNYGWY